MEAIARVVTLALLTLVPRIGAPRAKAFGDEVARASVASGVDPWVIVAVGRVETNWNEANLGRCCGGLMSIHWPGWERYARRHGLSTERRALEQLARDGQLSIRLAVEALEHWRRTCGPRAAVYLGAYQSGACHANSYGRLVERVATRLRTRFADEVRQRQRGVARRTELAPVSFALGEPPPPPGPATAATLAAGP